VPDPEETIMSRAVPRFKRVNANLPAVGTAQGVIVYKLIGAIENQQTVSTFTYFAPNFTPSSGQLTTLRANISTNIRALFLACVSSNWTITEEIVDVVHRNDLNGVFSLANGGAAGGRGAPALATTMALVMNRSTAIKGQHGRGRLSLPAICAADTLASRVNAAGLLTAVAALEVGMLLTASDGVNTWTPCIGQRANTSPRLIIGAAALTNVTGDLLLGTIRRRKIGRGV
jgi:hypothetical protein